MNEDPAERPIVEMAYRQAGHVLMAYLILEAGVADRFFALPIQPEDRAYLVPEFDEVNLEIDLGRADRPSPSLRSLITTPLFLMGGEAAERIHRGVPTEASLGDSVAIGRASGMMWAYMEEFGGDGSPESRARFSSSFRNFYEFTDGQVGDHWSSIEALAGALREEEELSRDAAFEQIERHLPDETRAAVARSAGSEGQLPGGR